MFKPLDTTPNFPELEEKTLAYWKENKTFERSIQIREGDKKWNFVDGPPFVTGMPHYGTLLSSIPKDLFGRYWTMKGYQVRRVWGWDGHGLPIENKVENKLGVSRKKDIEDKVGVKRFIEECYGYVNQMSSEWEWYVDHIARWVDFKNAYKTWDTPYMESVMWVFKQMYDKGHIYKGLRVSLFCPHCSTPISNFEVAMDPENYQVITEPANTYKYKLKDQDKTYLLAWSTTPWNKLVTPALAVNPELDYVKVEENGEYLILAKTTMKMLKSKEPKIVEEFKGEKLVGMAFEPHYDFYKIDPGKKAFIVIPGDFVTADEGTGVVTIAAYGEEDLHVMQRDNIQIVMHVDEEGKLKDFVPKWAGMYYLDVNEKVNQDLEDRGLMYSEANHTHSVPTCWRCHTRLFYAPQDAWYVNIQALKPQMKATNENVNWVPAHFKYGRFLKSMEQAPDWCISRSRYWGSPVPVWECECGERFVPGSIAELEQASGKKITDLHKPEIDEVTVTCKKCGKLAHSVPEVLDSWIEAGSAPYAERHYPFDTTLDLKDFFPPDFIVEYTGQIRAWFYVLHVISNILFNSLAFKNVVVTGVLQGTDGRKMSKNYGNYPDPKLMLQKYGGDALRLYLMGSSIMQGEDMNISEVIYRDQIKVFLLPLWNVYKYFTMYANVDGWKPSQKLDLTKEKLSFLDQWALSLTHSLVKDVTTALDAYDTMTAVTKLVKFIDDISKWYIRRSRDRVGPTVENIKDKELFYSTTYEVLHTFLKVAAPIAPFITELLYQNLTEEESVHLTNWPELNEKFIHKDLEQAMDLARKAAEEGHAKRKVDNIKVKIPIGNLMWTSTNDYSLINNTFPEIWEIVLKELNAKNITINSNITYPNPPIPFTEEELKKEGELRELIREIQAERKKLNCQVTDKVNITVPEQFGNDVAYIKSKVLAETVKTGEKLEVSAI
jgi:isoleucyl-tRNA synthetase